MSCRCQASLQILADLEVMGRADYFVASYHSKWAKLVEWLRYGLYQKDRSSSVDASADHADLFTVIYGLFNNNKVILLSMQASRGMHAKSSRLSDGLIGAAHSLFFVRHADLHILICSTSYTIPCPCPMCWPSLNKTPPSQPYLAFLSMR